MSAVATATTRFGTDLGTFMHPAFWGYDDRAEIEAAAERDPDFYWDKIMRTSAAAGLGTLELTVPPADVDTALRAYGSLEGFSTRLEEHGLGVYCSYFGGMEVGGDIGDDAVRSRIVAQARTEASYLAELGAEFVVLGLPAYPTGTGTPVDGTYVRQVAGLCDLIGAAVAEEGLRAALHTEAYSMFWRSPDIASLLEATDPAVVGFCPDTGHIALGGAEPAEVLQQHRDRFAMAHWKDTTVVAPDVPVSRDDLFGWLAQVFVPPGQGIVDWSSWIDALRTVSDIATVILEIDEAPEPVTALTSARDHINGLLNGNRPLSSERMDLS